MKTLNLNRFLEEVDHKIEDGMRVPFRCDILKGPEMDMELPAHLKILKNEAKKRETFITLMPKHFTRHQNNTTRFNFKEDIIRYIIPIKCASNSFPN